MPARKRRPPRPTRYVVGVSVPLVVWQAIASASEACGESLSGFVRRAAEARAQQVLAEQNAPVAMSA
jgi:hypothetical protein